MRLIQHVTLHFNNNISTAAVFLDIEKAFDTTWHVCLLYVLYTLQFSVSLIMPIGSFFLKENSDFLSKVEYLCQGIYKQGYDNVLPCLTHCTIYI
jgi:hypothetical protein